jgi:hypothetical protein
MPEPQQVTLRPLSPQARAAAESRRQTAAQRAVSGQIKKRYEGRPGSPPAVGPPTFLPVQEAKWLSTGSATGTKLGGSAAATGTIAPFQAQGKGYVEGQVRPSLLLQAKLQRVSGYLLHTKEVNEQLLITWINSLLKESQFMIEGSKGMEQEKGEAKEVKEKVVNLERSLSQLLKGGTGPSGELGEIQENKELCQAGLGELMQAITEVTKDSLKASLTDVQEAASSVVSSIPLLGTITAGVKIVYKGFKIGMLVREAYLISQAKANSFSSIETEVLSAIQSFQKKKGVQLGKEALATTAVGATAAFGGGAIADVGVKLANLLVNVTLKIIHLLEIRKANEALQEGKLTIDLLRSLPTLGLHLPHLEGVDALILLGVLPPGWRTGNKAEAIRNRLKELVGSADLGWLSNSLKWDDPTSLYRSPDESGLGGSANAAAHSAAKLANPWTPEYNRIVYMLEKTDQYINTQSWRLYRQNTILHALATTGFVEKCKEKTKEKLMHIFVESGPAAMTVEKSGGEFPPSAKPEITEHQRGSLLPPIAKKRNA